MAGRPPLVLETWGRIRRTTVNGQHVAVASYRDSDGVTRTMQRKGPTPAAAERALVEALRDRLTPSQGVTADMRVAALAELWWEEFEGLDRAVGTARRYRQVLNANILPGIGGLTVREATVGRLDRFIKATTEHTGSGTARICAVVLSGMFDMAARHDAIRANPMRSVAPVPKPEREIRAYTLDDVAELRALLREYDQQLDGRGMPRTTDLADVVDFFLGTGCRPGEVLAMRWEFLDLDAEPARARVAATAAYGKDGSWGIQERTKARKQLTLLLPGFVTEMLRRRRANSDGNPLVFPSSTGTVRARSNFMLQWHAALRGTRFEGEVPKTFRSTVATIIREQASVDVAREQLGHSSVTVTEGHYIKRATEAPDSTAILEAFNVLANKPRINPDQSGSDDQRIA